MSRSFIGITALLLTCSLIAQCGRPRVAPAAAIAYTGPSGAPYAASFDVASSSQFSPGGRAGAGVQLVGRFIVDGPQQIRFGWPNSALGGRFVGTSIGVEMEDVQPMMVKGEAVSNRFSVWVDGQPGNELTMQPGVSMYEIAANLSPGVHTIWLSKRTEGWVGSTTFLRFVPGTGGFMLKPPPPRARRLEFVGASNETGYGIGTLVTRDTMCHYSAETQNADAAYPRLTADALGADLVNIAFSGKGVWQNGDPVRDPSDTMAVLYDRADPLDPTSQWTFSGPPPQAVVVDLGGNDFASEPPPLRDFMRAYVGLLKRVRHHYPRAQIVCVMGPMATGTTRAETRSYIEAVVRARHEDNDDAVQYFEFPQYRGESLGCDYHPDAALHRSMANALRVYLADTLHW